MENSIILEAEPFEFRSEHEGYENSFDTESAWDGGQDRETRVPNTLAMRKPSDDASRSPVRARILWPALGFPAVIAPQEKPSESPFGDGDSTRCICVLVLTDKKFLSKEEAARYLRCVPWAERGRRYIPAGQPGSFREVDLAVRNVNKQTPLVKSNPSSSLGALVGFGGKDDRRNGIVANLAHYVKGFYEKQGLAFVQEIRVYESAMAQFPDGMYHLFWNNQFPGEKAQSDEMALLLRAFAYPRRAKLGKFWQASAKFLMEEYEFEYGALHAPYAAATGGQRTRAEILHPVFIKRRPVRTVSIGQLTDTHVDVRADVYEENLKQDAQELKRKGIINPIPYINWNKNFLNTYNAAKQESNVILLTGDLIDYGRGHVGIDYGRGHVKTSARKLLGDDRYYHVDRNWFLFYYLLASGKAYTRPVYTILGNHDWRLNPYPPFALAGTPSIATQFRDWYKITEEQQKTLLRVAHGPGYEPKISYDRATETRFQLSIKHLLRTAVNIGRLILLWLNLAFANKKQLDEPGFPTETSVESVAWYLFSINPFLDYWFTLPAGHKVLMLDWAKDENVFFGNIYRGEPGAPFTPSGIKSSTDEGPKARSCLTDLQAALFMEFTETPGAAKIIGIHAPPIGPWDDWYDPELMKGWKSFDYAGRGYPFYTRTTPADGKTIKGHPLFAIRPTKGIVPDAVWGMDAGFGSFERRRPEFIRRLADPKWGVRVVLSGHIHRKGMFVVYKGPGNWGKTLQGELFIQGVPEHMVTGARPPAVTTMKIPGAALVGPLYVNGTSVGPRGHGYTGKGMSSYLEPGYALIHLVNDGTIQLAKFRSLQSVPQTTPQPEAIIPVREAIW